MIPNHCIENNKQFTHAGGKDHPVSFALLFKAMSQFAYNRIETAGGKCGHVEDAADIFSAAPDMGFAIRFARRAVPGRHACKSGDLLAVECAQFGQIGNQHSAGLRADAGSALENAVFVFEIVIGINLFPDKQVDLMDLKVQGFDHFLDALFDLGVMDHEQTIGLLGSQVVKLPTSSDQLGQLNGLGLGMRFRSRFDDLSELGQYLRIDGVCLCPLPHAVGEITDLPRVDHDDRHLGTEQFRCDGAFVTAGGFEDNQSDGVVFEVLTELAMAIGRVGQAGFENVGASGDTEGVFGDIDTDIDRFRHGNLPYLQMRTRRACGSPAAVQTAVRANPTGAARFPLCDGLEGPDTIELSSPAGGGLARCATLCAGLRSARRATTGFTYETIINHGCQHTRTPRTQRRFPPSVGTGWRVFDPVGKFFCVHSRSELLR